MEIKKEVMVKEFVLKLEHPDSFYDRCDKVIGVNFVQGKGIVVQYLYSSVVHPREVWIVSYASQEIIKENLCTLDYVGSVVTDEKKIVHVFRSYVRFIDEKNGVERN